MVWVGCAFVAMAAGQASAVTILVSLGGIADEEDRDVTATGLTGPDGVLINWNLLTGSGISAGSVKDSDGITVAGVGIGSTNLSHSLGSTNSGQYASNGTPASWIDLDVIERYAATSNSTATIVFTGLTGSDYQVDVVSARSASAYVADYTVHGLPADTTPNGNNFASQGSGWTNGSVLTWNSVAPDTGSITIQADLDSGFILFNAVRLTEVPEPASATLIALGGALMLGRCRADGAGAR